jgi:hypothetical protein
MIKIYEILHIMFKAPKPKKPNDKDKRVYDPKGYMEYAKNYWFHNPVKFWKDLVEFDKDNISDAIIDRVKPMIEQLSEDNIKYACE